MEFKAKDRRLEGDTPLRQCQLVQLYLLEVFDEICKAHNLRYFLEFGTLLGAMRHGGAIPWDDDLDVSMPMGDYQKFIALAPRLLPTDILLQNREANGGVFLPYISRLRDTKSFLLDDMTQGGVPSGIFIDIYPLLDDPSHFRNCHAQLRHATVIALASESAHRKEIARTKGRLVYHCTMLIVWTIATKLLACLDKSLLLFGKNGFSQPPGAASRPWNLQTSEIFPLKEVSYEGHKFFAPNQPEAVLKRMDGVKDAVVAGYTEENGRSYLCAYYVADRDLDIEAARQRMAEKLTHYMIPAYWMRLDKMPVNDNGKLNRKALPKPQTGVGQKEYTAPIGEEETLLCRAFERVLHLDRIGAEDDFLLLGGDSIRAMEVSHCLGSYSVTAGDVLLHRTPKAIAHCLRKKEETALPAVSAQLSYAPLTDSQLGIYFQCIRRPESIMYNLPMRLTFDRGPAMTAAFVKGAVDNVIRLHPALYAFLKPEGENILSCRSDFPKDGVCTAAEAETDPWDGNAASFVRPFDLFKGPLCRAQAYLTKDKVILYFDSHHIVCDGASVTLLGRQFANALAGRDNVGETLDAFSVYELEHVLQTAEKDDADTKYYDELLCDVDADSKPLYDTKPRDDSNPADSVSRTLVIPALRDYLNKYSLTENSFFMGAFGYTLAKMTGANHSLLCAVESGRRDPRLDSTVSMFVRTVPVVCRPDETKPASVLLTEGQTQFFRSVDHDGYAFGKLAAQYGINADAMFVYEADMLSAFDSACGRVETTAIPCKEAFADFALSVWKRGDAFIASIAYRSDCYSVQTVQRFMDLYQTVCDAFAQDAVLKDIPLLSDGDKDALDALNQTESAYDDTSTIVDLFRRSAQAYPDKTALVYLDRRYTYREVDVLTDKMAAYIHAQNVEKGQTVSVLIPRCEYMLLASLAALKAGAVYQPLDPSYPAERLAFMCADADSKLLIADRSLVSLLPDYTAPVLYTDECEALPDGAYDGHPATDDACVLLYTSGTTGQPKGCRLLHRNVTAFMHAFDTLFHVDDTYVGAAYASYGFDAHISEIYPPMTVGGTLHIVSGDIRLDLPALKQYFDDNGITHTVMTTQLARQFVTEYPTLKSLRSILCGGEKLATLTPPATYTLTNGYGPTEATVMITCFTLDGVYTDIPIGRALPNAKLYVTDTFGRRLPLGVPGELIVYGPQVADGYLNRPEKTAEVFVPNTFDENAASAYRHGYKTGDIVRILPDGKLEIIGRRDSQVKIRGFRIELSEVESVIREYPDVADATVIAVDDPAGGKCLHAYIVGKNQVAVDVEKLNRYIASKKPPYMVPRATMQIDAIPLTPNLKVDKRKLPPIAADDTAPDVTSSRAKTDLEEKLCAILSDVVGHDRFGVETDFTAAGISSITSIRLAVQIYKTFGLKITSKDILDGGNVLSVENAIIAMLLGNKDSKEAQTALRDAYPLTQSQVGIYTDSLSRGTGTYYIGTMVQTDKTLPTETLKEAVRTAVNAHPSMLCTIFADADGTPRVHPAPDLDWTIDEETGDPAAVTPAEFTFTEAPLFRFRILHAQDTRYLLFEVHHIIADGESVRILMNDIAAACKGQPLSPETYTAFTMAEEEEKARGGNEFAAAKAYYDSVYRGVSADYMPAADRHDANAPGDFSADVPADAARIRRCCENAGVSENVFFTAAFALTLARFTSHADALFAAVHNGRGDPRSENVFAMAVKTIPVYIDIAPDCPVKTYLRNLDDRLKQLKKYDLYSFADAARKYGLSADPTFVYQGNLTQDASLGTPIPAPKGAGLKSALSFEVGTSEKGCCSVHVEYDAGKYSPAFIAGFVDAYGTVLSALADKTTAGEVCVTSDAALSQFASFNDTDWPVEMMPAYRLIENSVDRHPDKPAVIAGGVTLTYRELDNMANVLARQLCALGIPAGSTTAILLDRTAEIYPAQVGTLKAANAFLCLSPAYPDDRIRFIVEDASVKAVITTHAIAQARKTLLDTLDIPLLCVDDIHQTDVAPRLNLPVDPEALAYMIYTSGSTGKPKGVTVQQKGLVLVADPNPKNFETANYLQESDVSTAVSAFTFDASVYEGFIALAIGTTVCIASEDMIHDPDAFCRYCLQHGVTSMLGTPSFLLNLCDYTGFAAVASHLRAILAGGEEFTSVLLKKLLSLNPNLCILNGYGPSEATITCSCKQLTAGERITIGTPIANTKLYCLDAQNHILPMGALGELTVVGDTVGKGYLNRDDLTKRTFITVGGKSAFKTGDLAVITHDGEIEFHGRIDNQVKIRGLRVELGEIEAVMNLVDGIKSSVVVVRGDGENKYLAAYYTASRPVGKEEITAAVSQKLAAYMVPRHFMQLDTMPMTANGKIDKKALPEIVPQQAKTDSSAGMTDTEKVLCDLYASILKVNDVRPDDNFFDVGGNSLSASRAVMQLKAKGYEVEYQTVFDYQTPRALSAYLDRNKKIDVPAAGNNFSEADPTDPFYREVLSHNTLAYADQVERKPLGNVLLTGAVGFLGIHVLRELLVRETGHIYCLVRRGSFASPAARLDAISFYYFSECLRETYPDRISVVDADITSENLAAKLQKATFDTIINCAASVKHFAADDSIAFVNVHGVENLIDLAKAKNAKLIQISTTSVPGIHTAESLKNGVVLHENQLFMADDMNNKYILSKYHAEQRVLTAVKNGLRGKVIRVGNLMGRHADGEFQINMGSNAFLNALKGFAKIGKCPVSHCTDPMEFSPIDCTAQAIVALAGTNDCFTVFHANNRRSFDEMQLMAACTRCGLPIIPTDDKAYYEEYYRLLGDPTMNRYLSALLTNDRPDLHAVDTDNRFTANVLYRLGFVWPFIDNPYLDRVLTHLRDMGFFERETS